MLRRLVPLVLLTAAAISRAGEPRWPAVETIDDLARSYVLLVLRIDQHRPGFNDAYCGPAAWQERVEVEDPLPLAELRATADRLGGLARTVETDRDRRAWFRGQLSALSAYVTELEGEPLPFVERQRQLHGLRIESPDPRRIRAAWRELDRLEKDPDLVASGFEAWWNAYVVPPDDLERAFALALAHARRVSASRVPPPEKDAIEVTLVGKRDWSAYEWYLGGGRSRIEVNREREHHAAFVVQMAAHEGYPGHHAELARREQLLVRQQGRVEWSVLPYFTPQACMIEATAEVAARLVFEDPRTGPWLRDVFLPALGHENVDIESWLANHGRLVRLRRVADQEALWFWCEPDRRWIPEPELSETLGGGSRVRDRLDGHPGLRSFGPCYTVGRDLVQRYLELGDPWKKFAKLTTAPLHPDLVERWIREERARRASSREPDGSEER